MEYSYTSTQKEVLAHFKVSEDGGLSEEQVLKQRERHGCNGTSALSELSYSPQYLFKV
jgi:hypothetical protein